MKVDVLLGLQWGDEGKGKIVDVLTPKYNIIARFQGGPNAGHTLEFNGIKHVLHIIPSGIFHDDSSSSRRCFFADRGREPCRSACANQPARGRRGE